MYTSSTYRDVEPKCYETDHILEVENEIKKTFPDYFNKFIASEAGSGVSPEQFKKLQATFGVKNVVIKEKSNTGEVLDRIIRESIDEFLKDRPKYEAIFDLESLEEYEDDASTFKSIVLKNQCPIIQKTIANRKAKELDQYRIDFNTASAEYLLSVVTHLCEFGQQYYSEYDRDSYEDASSYKDLNLETLQGDDYTAYGVIGGGIKTHMLFKVWPEVFSSRSRSALWALWHLTNKKSFGCNTDSEFLMINTSKVITQQNYFYPYPLFAWYAFTIYKLIKAEAEKLSVTIDPSYRYVIVDRFFNFVADQHAEQIALFQSQIANGGKGYD